MNGPTPDTERLARLQQQLSQSWRPVKSVPSVAQTAVALVLALAVVGIVIALYLGTTGIQTMQWGQIALYFGVLVAAVSLMAPAVVRRFRPGALIRFNAAALAAGSFFVLTAVVYTLFPSLDVSHFSAGRLCLERGTITGAIASVLFGLMLRRGFAPNPMQAAAATGFFSGLCGVFMLAINCPLHTTSHIVVWHLTVLLVTSATGAIIGWILARVR